ncbi:tyrosine-protein phosphatase [Diplogelasinospora grovesii]|uniref:protein-tyrosine-phosphatase n=1 Tax=Diplogelasinospora grovesii TaxID=303347 RepID=A0AAN6RZZ0_9PEZI|nr:tyrosine-protein phosphatase [Diplogelasinospora grovesii]
MALNRISGREDIYVGGVFGVRRPRLITEYKITHVLSVIKYALDPEEDAFRGVEHLSIDIDDLEDQDILVHLPKTVRFIERGLYGGVTRQEEDTVVKRATGEHSGISPAEATKVPPSSPDPSVHTTPAELARLSLTPLSSSTRGPSGPAPTGAVLVHCAMGKSRSVTAVIAYLLWKHPHRFGRTNHPENTTSAGEAVAQALKWVRESRPMAEPNGGFMRQLEMWWDMGCPADSDDAVEREPAYQRWLYHREVEDAARIGRAPDWIRFEDEEAAKEKKEMEDAAGQELRCKKCRRVLVTKPFVVPHQGRGNAEQQSCPHFFVEALSWMRPVLEEGALDGRLVCPNAKCGASVGRYAWQGFKCSCGKWVAPAFSLQKSKVDEVLTTGGAGMRRDSGPVATSTSRMLAMGIRMPPGAGAGGPLGGRKENL